MTRKPESLKDSFRRELDKLASKQPDESLLDAYRALADRDDSSPEEGADSAEAGARQASSQRPGGSGDGEHNPS